MTTPEIKAIADELSKAQKRLLIRVGSGEVGMFNKTTAYPLVKMGLLNVVSGIIGQFRTRLGSLEVSRLGQAVRAYLMEKK